MFVFAISKSHTIFYGSIMGYGIEREHLKELTEKDKASTIERVKELSGQGKSQRQISAELGISLGCVNKYLKL
jgi:hypothetical protein